MRQHCQIIELLADNAGILAVFVIYHVLYQRMVRIQDQGALSAHIHSVHGVHLHHFLHTAVLL